MQKQVGYETRVNNERKYGKLYCLDGGQGRSRDIM